MKSLSPLVENAHIKERAVVWKERVKEETEQLIVMYFHSYKKYQSQTSVSIACM